MVCGTVGNPLSNAKPDALLLSPRGESSAWATASFIGVGKAPWFNEPG